MTCEKREREMEAAHDVWLIIDTMTPSKSREARRLVEDSGEKADLLE